MKRRKLLVSLLLGVVAPGGALSQQKAWRVGFLAGRARPVVLGTDYFGAFPRGMRELGYVEGKNLIIEWRFADGHSERLPHLAAELVKLKVDVIVTAGTPATRAAQQATTTVPVVMGSIADPVGSGLVASLRRPGSNITGLANALLDIISKHVELLSRMVPKLARMGVLVNPGNRSHAPQLKNVRAAAEPLGIKVLAITYKPPEDLSDAFLRMLEAKTQAVVVLQDPSITQQRQRVVDLTRTHRVPAIFAYREYVEAGGLMSYGQSNADQYFRAAAYVDKIFKGAKPGDLPIEQPTRMELVINMKTANLLGLAIPNELLVSADVI
jgi:putative ABC transport system substrate-binding protein